MAERFSLRARLRSFRHAFAGLWVMLRSQHNAWLHALATVAVVVFGIIARLSTSEWCWIVLAILTVWTAEAVNTSFELLADASVPEQNPLIKKAKDVAAGAVLIAAAGAVVIGVLVLGPHVMRLIGG